MGIQYEGTDPCEDAEILHRGTSIKALMEKFMGEKMHGHAHADGKN